MSRLLGFTFLIFLSTLALQAQDRQYIVKLNRDTIYGKLQMNPLRDNSQLIYFKADDGEKMNLRPLRAAYVYYNQKYQFRSVIFANRRLFMQIVREDERVSLYNYIHKRDNSLVTSRVVIRQDGEAVEISILNFKNQMIEFLEDCPPVVAKLESRAYKFKHYQTMLAEYNQCELLQYPSNPTATSQAATPPPAVTSETSQPVPPVVIDPQKSDIQLLRLNKLEEFEQYVTGLQNFQFRSDVLELVNDLENRVHQNSDIPNYLWSTLEAMVQDDPELTEKTKKLKIDIK
ncbi:MAG: hypothetical protein OER04_00720 [Cyclobacteriaceae bacterium]|nr:hypothetical protein [Cyclobacteriaceae bacterium]